eukprot:GHVT01071660.1.p1 GENE.GHVT01071660.1~~GHVT01071660.1.p1  ORF type:complete len:342 (-),score=59.76 GHVT01071660.1:669-1694(-)
MRMFVLSGRSSLVGEFVPRIGFLWAIGVTMSTTNPTHIGTEWDDIQRKYGNRPARPVQVTEEKITRDLVCAAEEIDVLASRNLEELEALEDTTDQQILDAYKARRLQELKAQRVQARYGAVQMINHDDFIVEVTDASRVDPTTGKATCSPVKAEGSRAVSSNFPVQLDTGLIHRRTRGRGRQEESEEDEQDELPRNKRGTWVVVLVFDGNSNISCLLRTSLNEVARRHPQVKFCAGPSSSLLPTFPSASLPAVLIYFAGVCQRQLLGAQPWLQGRACDRTHVTPDSVEKTLRTHGVLGASAPSKSLAQRDEEGDESDEERSRNHNKGYSSMKFDSMMAAKR